MIRGIELISCLYVNASTGEFWVIDYHLYNLDSNGNSKLDHVQEMFKGVVFTKQLLFAIVLMIVDMQPKNSWPQLRN